MKVRTKFTSLWAFAERVCMDNDDSIKGTITGFQFRVTRDPIIEVSWFHNGEAKTGWFEEWRLSLVDNEK